MLLASHEAVREVLPSLFSWIWPQKEGETEAALRDPLENVPGRHRERITARAAARAVLEQMHVRSVERFDIEPYSDFSANDQT